MPENKSIVINTGPIIAITAALGDLSVLRRLYDQVFVPYEVCREVLAGGVERFAIAEFKQATWLRKSSESVMISPYFASVLGSGEASVIQLALDENITNVCIDETTGRRIARLSGLRVTGSIGILIRAESEGIKKFSMRWAIQRMRERGIWVSEKVEQIALKQTEE